MTARPAAGKAGEYAVPPGVDGYPHGRVPREVRERQMLDVAEQAFCEHGYTGTSIEEVCRRAGLKRPLFYTYFGGKTGLYLACYRRARTELDTRFAAVGADLDAATDDHSTPALQRAFDAVSRAYFQFLAESPTRWDMLYGPGAATAGDVAAEIVLMREQTIDLLASIIARHVGPDVPARVVAAYAHAVSGTGEQLARWWRLSPDIPIEEMAAHASAFIWGGLQSIAG